MYKTTSFLVVSLSRNKEKRVNYISLVGHGLSICWYQRVISKETGCLIHLAFTIHETIVTTLLLKQLICFYSDHKLVVIQLDLTAMINPTQFRRGGKNLGNLGIVDIDVDPACTSGFLNTIHIPSTFVYEAISKFDRKLDVFSFGHLVLREIEFGYKRERLQSGTTK